MKIYSLALPLLLIAAPPAFAQRSAEVERLCTTHDSHSEQRECLEAHAKRSRTRLEAEETSARAALLQADQVTKDRERAAQAFDKSVQAFRRYRTEQCEFVASLAFGGNAQGDRRLLCEIDLNEKRILQLQADLKHAV